MAIFAAVLVCLTLVAMTSDRIPAVLALIIALVVAGLVGVATPAQLFAGLANGGVITIAAMLVIAKGVLATGVVSRVTFRLLAGVHSTRQMLVRPIPPVGLISALINTTPIVAMLIPATREVEQRTGVPARSVLLPIAHATTLAGATTLIGTSSNLIVAGIADDDGVQLSMFSFLPVALPVALIGWLVLIVASRRLQRSTPAPEGDELDWRAEIPVAGRALGLGRTPSAIGMDRTAEFELIGIRRWGEYVDVDSPLEEADLLVYRTSEAGVKLLWSSPWFGIAPNHLFTATIDPHNAGTTIRDLQDEEDLMVVAARTEERFRDTPAEAGAVVYVSTSSQETLTRNAFLGLWQNVAGKAPQPGKAPIALGILLAVILAASFGAADVELIAPAGAALMVLCGVLTPRSAARALDWNILAIIAGSIGLGVIVVESGLSQHLADGLLSLSAGSLPVTVAVIVLGTTLLTNVVANAAAASILTPVALTIAVEMDLNPVLLLTVVATCISFTFINPYSHQSNLMVLEPGRYSTRTFVRFGIPLTVVAMLAAFGVAWPLLAFWH